MLTEKIMELVKQGIEVTFRPDNFVGPHCASIMIELRKDNHAITQIVTLDAISMSRINDAIYWYLDKMHDEFTRYIKAMEEDIHV